MDTGWYHSMLDHNIASFYGIAPAISLLLDFHSDVAGIFFLDDYSVGGEFCFILVPIINNK